MAVEVSRSKRIVLALNCGSSSLKFGLYEMGLGKPVLLCEGEAEQLGKPQSQFWFKSGGGEKQTLQIAMPDSRAALQKAMEVMRKSSVPEPQAIGHRIVHGGNKVRDHVLITDEVIANLNQAIQFAPLHVPVALEIVAEARKNYPGLPQAACLDTAFHRSMPDVSRTIPLPRKIREMGVEKYGFHGLSVQSVIEQLADLPQRLIVAHLGGGCSITAVHQGRSVDNTMGLTPTGGIMMGTRTGDLDPGVLVFLLRHGYNGADKLEDLLDHQSGLLGVAGSTSDMREMERTRRDDSLADLALRVFAYQVRKAIGAMAASLCGLDALVFTGGIGEHAATFRQQVVSQLGFLGAFAVHVLPSEEEKTIAVITAGLCE